MRGNASMKKNIEEFRQDTKDHRFRSMEVQPKAIVMIAVDEFSKTLNSIEPRLHLINLLTSGFFIFRYELHCSRNEI